MWRWKASVSNEFDSNWKPMHWLFRLEAKRSQNHLFLVLPITRHHWDLKFQWLGTSWLRPTYPPTGVFVLCPAVAVVAAKEKLVTSIRSTRCYMDPMGVVMIFFEEGKTWWLSTNVAWNPTKAWNFCGSQFWNCGLIGNKWFEFQTFPKVHRFRGQSVWTLLFWEIANLHSFYVTISFYPWHPS